MSYNCVVCVKQVPDTTDLSGQAMKEDGTVNRGALPAVFNPEDMNALEQALAIRDQYGGTVTVITMGLPKACDVLRESLFRGADRVILITDRRAAGSDTLATGYILACAIKKLKADIVLCGRQAIDGDTAQVGPQLAEKIDFTLITYLEEIKGINGKTITIKRNVGNGWEVVSAELPVLVTVMDTAGDLRPPSIRKLAKAKKAMCTTEVQQAVKAESPDATEKDFAAQVTTRCEELETRGLLIEQLGLDDIGADLSWCGLAGSPTKVHRVQSIVLGGGDYKNYPPTDQGVGQLVGELIEDHSIG